MFTAPTDELLCSLDHISGSRQETWHVIAMASAAVLTASPHGKEADWLGEVERCLTVVSGARRVEVTPRRADPRGPVDEAKRQRALRHLLDELSTQYGQNASATLKRLTLLAVEALASAERIHFERWSQFLLCAHRLVQTSYLMAHPDLN